MLHNGRSMRAFAWMHNNPRTIMDWQAKLVAIPAPPFGEGLRAPRGLRIDSSQAGLKPGRRPMRSAMYLGLFQRRHLAGGEQRAGGCALGASRHGVSCRDAPCSHRCSEIGSARCGWKHPGPATTAPAWRDCWHWHHAVDPSEGGICLFRWWCWRMSAKRAKAICGASGISIASQACRSRGSARRAGRRGRRFGSDAGIG